MSSKLHLMRVTSSAEGDRFLAAMERLQQEADPVGEATYEITAEHRRFSARKVSDGSAPPGANSMSGVGPFERLVDSLRGRLDLPRPASVAQALRNAELRTVFLAEVGALTASEVAQIAGSKAKNSSALASRWRSERRIFAVPWGGELLYPAFQFANGEPRPAIARVIETFGERPSGWEIALWFATPSGHLPGNGRPLERLDDPDALIVAARAELSAPDF